MSITSGCIIGFVLCVLAVLSPQAHAIFTLKVTSAPTRVTLGGTVTYSISVSNTVLVNSVRVTSQFDNAEIISANNVASCWPASGCVEARKSFRFSCRAVSAESKSALACWATCSIRTTPSEICSPSRVAASR